MDKEVPTFYENYSPPTEVEKRLGPLSREKNRKVPLRDLLGILEKNGAWTEESSLTTGEIGTELEEWDDTGRDRLKTPPKTDQAIRTAFKKLRKANLVFKIEKNGTNHYWKRKDGELPRHWLYTKVDSHLVERLRLADDVILERFLLKNIFTKLSIFFLMASGVLTLFGFEFLWITLAQRMAMIGIVSLIFGIGIDRFASRENNAVLSE